MHVEEIVTNHWKSYGRNYYCRYDYEGVESGAANAVLTHLRSQFSSLTGKKFGSYEVFYSVLRYICVLGLKYNKLWFLI